MARKKTPPPPPQPRYIPPVDFQPSSEQLRFVEELRRSPDPLPQILARCGLPPDAYFKWINEPKFNAWMMQCALCFLDEMRPTLLKKCASMGINVVSKMEPITRTVQ